MINQATGRREGAVSFENRIAAVALATAVAVLIAAAGTFILQQWRAERVMNDHAYAAVVKMVAADAGPVIVSPNKINKAAVFSGLSSLPRIGSAEVIDAKGQVVAEYKRSFAIHMEVGRLDLRTEPVTVNGKTVGSVLVHIDQPTLMGMLPRYVAVSGALFFIAAGIALFLGRWLAKRVTKPVQNLAEAMAEITGSSNDYNRRVEPMYDDEVGKLTESFNELMQRLHSNDIKLREAMDDLVEARDQAEAANVLKSHFLANMSHEIRTPLNGVLAMAQIMAMSDLTDQQRERLDVIRKSGESLLAVLNDILDLSKIEAGRMELEPAPFETASTIRQAFAGFAGMAEKKGLEFSIDVDPMAEGWRHGDAARISQIVNNLISNAIKFTEKGSVSLRVEPEGDDGEAGFRLLISDTGMGIAPDKQSYMFEKFSQLDGSATRRFGGTGLGLAICRELAQLMGGEITVWSVVGEGSTFTVTLPLQRIAYQEPAPQPIVETHADAEDAEDERPLRVLAAEDNATNQLVLRTVMQTFGADLTMVGDGKQAVDAWEKGEFDIILMDIQMPEMDGLTATRTIRDQEIATGRARTPVVAVSANAMTHQVKEYLDAGMDGHVAKPIELMKLHGAMAKALEANAELEAAREASAA